MEEKTTNILVRHIPTSLVKAIDVLAKREQRSREAEIRVLLSKAMKEMK